MNTVESQGVEKEVENEVKKEVEKGYLIWYLLYDRYKLVLG